MSDQEQGLGEGPRLALALALSAGVMFLWFTLFPPPKPEPPPPGSELGSELGAPANPGASLPGLADGLDMASPGSPGATATPAAPVPRFESHLEVVVRTPLFEASFSGLGAVQTGMVLLEYPETHDEDSDLVELIDGRSSRGALAFDLFPRGGKRRSTADIVFRPDRNGLELGAGQSGSIVFTGVYPGIGEVEKEYRFEADQYRYELEVRVRPQEGVDLQYALLSLDETASEGREGGRWDLIAFKIGHGTTNDDEDLNSLRKKARKGKFSPLVYSKDNGKGLVRWAGFDEHYFLRVILPDLTHEPMAQVNVRSMISDPMRGNVQPVQLDVVTPFRSDPETGVATFDYGVYFGPKSLSLLAGVDATLTDAIDFGYVSFLSKFFVEALTFFYGFTANWGVAIIILTIIVRMLLFPLTLKSMQSMERMRELQPEQNAIREKYKDEPEKMQKEWMALYKRHKVNPLGGCLPMLLQFPIFIGLYYALAQAIELRHADFAFWLTDLSAPDPFYITPILMGATMFWLQRMQPMAAMDPMQQKILQWMPVMFTFFFINFPSGLVLYWLFSNLVSIAQQYWIRGRKKTKTAQTPAVGSTS